MNFGNLTTEGINEEEKSFLHVYNFRFKKEYRSICLDFIKYRIIRLNELKPNWTHKIRIDLRGQYLTLNTVDNFRGEFYSWANKMKITTEMEFLATF